MMLIARLSAVSFGKSFSVCSAACCSRQLQRRILGEVGELAKVGEGGGGDEEKGDGKSNAHERIVAVVYSDAMRSKVAEWTREELDRETLAMTPAERIELAFALGERDLLLY